MGKINVLVVDDSAFMRKLISDFLSENEQINICGTAKDGEDALRKIEELKPDVVTMDVEMPKLNGLDALKRIMEVHPLPVVMLASATKEGAEKTMNSIQLGAADFISKPSGSISLDLFKIKQELAEKVIAASRISAAKLADKPLYGKNTIKLYENYSKIEPETFGPPLKPGSLPAADKLVCIGTSTGGPRAPQKVFSKLPGTLDAPVLVVQHMPPGFTKSLADRLDLLSELCVKEAEHGELLKKGTAYIAPGGLHLTVQQTKAGLMAVLSEAAPVNGHRPSVDILFESASMIENCHKIAVILTGMGSDGTKGLSAIKSKGNASAIAESKDSAIVFGMPRTAIETGLVDKVANIEEIAEKIKSYV